MTSAVLNPHAPEHSNWLASITGSLGVFIAGWSSRNAENNDVAQMSAHQLEDIGLTATNTQAIAPMAPWAV